MSPTSFQTAPPRDIIECCSFSRTNGWRWIRTTEASCSRFTVCPLWPLGNPSIFFLFDGTNRARTYDPLLVRQMLSQLSYDPKILIYKLFTNKTTRMGFEPTTSAVTGRRSNQLSHQAIYIVDFSGPSGTRTQDRPVMSRLL